MKDGLRGASDDPERLRELSERFMDSLESKALAVRMADERTDYGFSYADLCRFVCVLDPVGDAKRCEGPGSDAMDACERRQSEFYDEAMEQLRIMLNEGDSRIGTYLTIFTDRDGGRPWRRTALQGERGHRMR